jgi:hypothetical protein
MDTLVRPGPYRLAPPAVHHVVDEDVQNAPTLAEVVDRFKGTDVYVAHNYEFEPSFFAAQGIELCPWICQQRGAFKARQRFSRVIHLPCCEKRSIAPSLLQPPPCHADELCVASRFAAICDVGYLVKMRIDRVRDLVKVTPLLAKFRGFMSRL